VIDLIIKSENEGLNEEEAVELAAFYLASGMVNSNGSIGRFVDNIASMFPVELDEALDAYNGKLVPA